MSLMTSSLRNLTASSVAAVCLFGPLCLFGSLAEAEEVASDSENGRYTMSATADGVIRLDTRTGGIATCNNSVGTGWACYAVPDERAAMDAEIGRLQAENEKLKAQLAARDQTVTGKIDEPLPKDQALPKSDQLKRAEPKPGASTPDPRSADGSRKLEIPLPSDQDMDRAMTFLEQAWRRLIDMAMRVQKDVSGRI
ncbi:MULTISPECIES: hypothetical protein [unclassified Bradyrhizobium]|uniref:hypothetical protein n=1 Tax=unclassified Bradyrhizobium TaxID=2631580 RepID=UPI002916F0C7|nr:MULTISPECIES: hypothetical protein [unclassified Bradyrhizobium]